MQKSFLSKQNSTVYLLSVKPEKSDGLECYYFVKIYDALSRKFQNALKLNQNFDLKQYGEILEWGYNQPHPELLKTMQLKYNLVL